MASRMSQGSTKMAISNNRATALMHLYHVSFNRKVPNKGVLQQASRGVRRRRRQRKRLL